MEKVIITAKGASMKSNNWTEGQEVECHENLASLFIERGIAVKERQITEVKIEEPKRKKEKKKQ